MFWQKTLVSVAPRSLSVLSKPCRLVYSDASATGGGSFVCYQGVTCQLTWSFFESQKSSAWRELRTVDYSLTSFSPVLRHCTVIWHTDNQALPSIVFKGSMKQELQALALSIYDTCQKFNITLDLRWIPRAQNKVADSLSRFVDLDDWAVTRSLFDWLDARFGPHTVDRFATDSNKQLNRFNSRFSSPGSEAVDAFSQTWNNDNNWLVPPPCLISKCIRHLLVCKAQGTLVAPYWPSQSFWPILFPNGDLAPFITDCLTLPIGADYLVAGKHAQSIFHPKRFRSSLLVLRLNGSCT